MKVIEFWSVISNRYFNKERIRKSFHVREMILARKIEKCSEPLPETRSGLMGKTSKSSSCYLGYISI